MLSTEEVARLLRVAPGTLARWRSVGKGPPFQRRGLSYVIYDLDELRSWAKSEGVMIWEDEKTKAANDG